MNAVGNGCRGVLACARGKARSTRREEAAAAAAEEAERRCPFSLGRPSAQREMLRNNNDVQVSEQLAVRRTRVGSNDDKVGP